MRLNNQAKVGLTCVACLLVQGYIFTYVLLLSLILCSQLSPVPLPCLCLCARKRTWYFNKPFYWIGLIIAITLLDILPLQWLLCVPDHHSRQRLWALSHFLCKSLEMPSFASRTFVAQILLDEIKMLGPYQRQEYKGRIKIHNITNTAFAFER